MKYIIASIVLIGSTAGLILTDKFQVGFAGLWVVAAFYLLFKLINKK